jgi:hypothetical protein
LVGPPAAKATSWRSGRHRCSTDLDPPATTPPFTPQRPEVAALAGATTSPAGRQTRQCVPHLRNRLVAEPGGVPCGQRLVVVLHGHAQHPAFGRHVAVQPDHVCDPERGRGRHAWRIDKRSVESKPLDRGLRALVYTAITGAGENNPRQLPRGLRQLPRFFV